jgi:PIN domain nuclease of toxin-antitoxin system
VVCEAFEILSEGNRTAVERVLPVFQEIWSKYDPNATGFIHEKNIEALLRQIPEPIGVSFTSSFTHVRARGDYLRLHRVGDQIGFTDVLCGLVAIWLTEEGQTVNSEIAVQMNRLSASIIINSASRRWIQNRQVRLNKKSLNEEMEREKMRREDTRLTDIMKKATMKVTKLEPLLFKNLQKAQEEKERPKQKNVGRLAPIISVNEDDSNMTPKDGVGYGSLTLAISERDMSQSSMQLSSGKYAGESGAGGMMMTPKKLLPLTSESKSAGWMLKSPQYASATSPQVKEELQKIERFLGDRYEEL